MKPTVDILPVTTDPMIDNKSISSIPLHDVNMPNADLTNRRTAMRVLSWNIHDLSEKDKGPKTEDMDFMKIFDNCPIFCLQETKGNISIPDYECKNKLRKGSRSGGLCIGVHRSFAQKFKELDTECEDIQAVTVSLGTNNCGKETGNGRRRTRPTIRVI